MMRDRRARRQNPLQCIIYETVKDRRVRSLSLAICLWPPEQYIGPRMNGEIYISFDLMCNVGTEASTHHTVPSLIVIAIKFFPDEISYTSVNIPTCNSQGKCFPVKQEKWNKWECSLNKNPVNMRIYLPSDFDGIFWPILGHVLSKYLRRKFFRNSFWCFLLVCHPV